MARSRRTFLKAAGIASATTFAGCLGGSNSGGSGNGGGGGSGSEQSEVNITLAPDGFLGIIMDHIHKDTDILSDAMSEVGYTANVQTSWEDSALFASGGPDFSTMSSLEAALLATEREMDLSVIGRISPQYMGWMVDTGGDYDPDETGSVQASIDAIVEDDALVGIGAWNGGHVPSDTIALQEVFGYEFSQEGGDFRVTTADYIAIPQLINDGKLAAGSTSPEHGGAKFLAGGKDEITELFWGTDVAKENGLGVPQLNSLITTQEFVEQHGDAAAAMQSALKEGVAWLFDDPKGIMTEEAHIEQLGVNTAEEAEYIVDWGINLEYNLQTPMMFEDPSLTDSFIEADKTAIQQANDIGFVPDGWQDRITYTQVDEL
ncbi:hypothetical protein [Halogeometricum limi]|uniref:Uncharacterized protein n=1 Tax=Halogeometricum limi TaxID=555875 RepID=A0A1I6ICG8_9EURY|nr:hypothetical protein [Halogeometricum limi]SFR64309.1 hypothetical protein SAMN04488124_3026 [Halogeometricum limi]